MSTNVRRCPGESAHFEAFASLPVSVETGLSKVADVAYECRSVLTQASSNEKEEPLTLNLLNESDG